jgi:histidinol-phosphate aminotransferase
MKNMGTQLNRRSWIKSSAVLAGSLAFFAGDNSLFAKSPALGNTATEAIEFESDEAFFRNAETEIKARLSANENPFGPSAKAKKAIMDGIEKSYRYSFSSAELAAKVIAFEGLKPGTVSIGAGSSSFLSAGAKYFSKGGGSIITGDPSYNDLPAEAAELGARVIKVPLTADYKLDLAAMEKTIDSTTKLVYLCNPNNPTATTVDTKELKAFIAKVSPKVPVFVDEAYIDYVKDPQSVTVIDCIKQGMNVIVLRTFSKLYGFAGLRIGYMVAQPTMLMALNKLTEGGMSISGLSMKAALASYQDREFMDDALAKTFASKAFLYETLKKEGYDYIPSEANFVLFPIKMEGRKFSQEMGKRGVSLRSWQFAGKDWCRVSIGTMDEMKAFASAFSEIA